MDEQVYNLIRKCNVLKRAQLDAFFGGKEKAMRRAVRRLSREGRMVSDQLTGMVAVNEIALKQKDTGTLCALWVVAELKRRGLAEDFFLAGREEYPIRLVIIGKGEIYDVLYVGMQESALVGSILERIPLPECKHLLIVEKPEQMKTTPLRHVFAFCLVTEEGKVSFYEGWKKGTGI